MILYYAVGGGLGHLTRAQAVIYTLHITEPVTILTASPFAADSRLTKNTDVITIPFDLSNDPGAYSEWLADILNSLSPQAIYLDTFPAGIIGEFCTDRIEPGIPLFHFARILRWPQYYRYLSAYPPKLKITYRLEPLLPEYEEYLQKNSERMIDLKLDDRPERLLAGRLPAEVERLADGSHPVWLVVHSGPEDEILELIAYAETMSRMENLEPKIILISPHRLVSLTAHIEQIDYYPAFVLFPFAERIISACGSNIMRQMKSYRHKHRYMPFKRRFDDQFFRAKHKSVF